MTRIRNVLQSRADRFRRKYGNNVLQEEEENHFNRSLPYDNETQLTDQCIRSKEEPDGVEPDGVSLGSIYSLEAKDTRATMAETFSSGEENTAYSDDNDNEIFTENRRNMNFSKYDGSHLEDGGTLIDIADEEARQQNDSSSGVEFIDLVRESALTERVGVDRSDYTYKDEDNIVTHAFVQPETIEFVDSEDGKVFEILQSEVGRQDGLLQNVRSLDHTHNDECSKTLNTNHETLQAPYMPDFGEDSVDQMNCSERFRNLQVEVEGDEPNEEYDQGASPYENNGYNEEDHPINQENSELYDCDDGQVYFPHPAQEDGDVGQPYELERDGTFFEQMRSVQSRNSTHLIHLEMEPENWQSVTQQIHLENPENAHLDRQSDGPASPQLEDPYLSDSNSSWEEGSFATGASRTVSRVDTACDDYDDEEEGDDAGTYDGTFDGTEYYSDDNTYAENNDDRPFVRILKKFRDMNVDDEQSDYESDDEEDEEDNEDRKKRTESKQKRRSKPKATSVFERIGELGMDILNETIEHAESQDRAPRRQNSRNEGGTIINSIADLFSCGAPSGY